MELLPGLAVRGQDPLEASLRLVRLFARLLQALDRVGLGGSSLAETRSRLLEEAVGILVAAPPKSAPARVSSAARADKRTARTLESEYALLRAMDVLHTHAR